jgi:hypothetical protein
MDARRLVIAADLGDEVSPGIPSRGARQDDRGYLATGVATGSDAINCCTSRLLGSRQRS